MYKRDEEIKDESLDWEEQDKQPPEEVKQMKLEIPSQAKRQKSFQHKETGLSEKLAVKKNVTSLYNANVALFLGAGILVLPYILGFVITYFLFAFYGGMTIGGFVNIDKAYLPFQLWSMGAYLLVTAWLIWAVLNTFKKDR